MDEAARMDGQRLKVSSNDSLQRRGRPLRCSLAISGISEDHG